MNAQIKAWLDRHLEGEINEGSDLPQVARMIANECKVSYAVASEHVIEWLRQSLQDGDIETTIDGYRLTLGDCTIFVPKKPAYWRGEQWERKPFYRFSFWFKDSLIVSHLDAKDKHFVFSPSPLGKNAAASLLECAAHFMTLRPGDTDDEFFSDYDLVQAMWVSSFECDEFGGLYYDRFEGEL